MKLVTWNVNSIRSRLDRVLDFIKREDPDILCLQELKATEDDFPHDVFWGENYHAAVHGQKTYNGVAIISRSQASDVRCGFDDDTDDPQARLISANVDGVRVINGYFPNGQTVGSEKWEYKLTWMARLRDYLDRYHTPDEQLVVCGDTNIAIDDADVANPESWAESVLCAEPGRAALSKIVEWGLTDVFREHHPEGGIFSWWDYRQLAFPKNDGLRIDHILATASLAARCVSAEIDRDERKGAKPSDHAPVIATFK
jgi:exodeoxyribonuclease-3